MKRLILLLTILMWTKNGQAFALPMRTVYAQDLDSLGIELKVWSGYGLTINFIPTGEIIQQVWIGDPSRIALTSNGNLCQKTEIMNSSQNCTNTGATVLFLRQIKPINFPNLTSSDDKSTQLTVITSGTIGQKQYQFRLIPAKGNPDYTSLVVKPRTERPKPLVLVRVQPSTNLNSIESPKSDGDLRNIRVSPVRSVTSGMFQRDDANAVAFGLAIAVQQGQIKPNSPTWNKIQDAIRLLRQGLSKEEARIRSGVTISIFNQLIEWGKNPRSR